MVSFKVLDAEDARSESESAIASVRGVHRGNKKGRITYEQQPTPAPLRENTVGHGSLSAQLHDAGGLGLLRFEGREYLWRKAAGHIIPIRSDPANAMAQLGLENRILVLEGSLKQTIGLAAEQI